jgi:hemerythrin-like metal-binding domain
MRQQWEETLATGLQELDSQNRELLEHIDALLNAESGRRAKEELEFLEACAERHFAREQRLHEQSGYPQAETHMALHHNYLATFRRLKKRYLEQGPTLSNILSFHRNIVQQLKEHIRLHDKAFVEYRNAGSTDARIPHELPQYGIEAGEGFPEGAMRHLRTSEGREAAASAARGNVEF